MKLLHTGIVLIITVIIVFGVIISFLNLQIILSKTTSLQPMNLINIIYNLCSLSKRNITDCRRICICRCHRVCPLQSSCKWWCCCKQMWRRQYSFECWWITCCSVAHLPFLVKLYWEISYSPHQPHLWKFQQHCLDVCIRSKICVPKSRHHSPF